MSVILLKLIHSFVTPAHSNCYHYPILGSPEFSVSSLMTRHCCSSKNVSCFKMLTQAAIERVRTSVYSKSETEQTQLILSYMLQHSQEGKPILYTVGGQKVCKICFRMVYGFRYNRFKSVEEKFKNGVLTVEHGRLGMRRLRDESCRLVSWLRMFIDKVGDRMPTSTAVHLPSCLTKSDIYTLASDDLTQGGLKCCKISMFYEIWKQHFPNVKIPKVL